MNRRKRPLWALILSLLALAGLVYLILAYSPDSQPSILNLQFPILYLFFLSIFTFLLFIIFYFLRSPRRGALIGFLIIIYLIFRMLHLNSPYFLLLLIALYVSLELFFRKNI